MAARLPPGYTQVDVEQELILAQVMLDSLDYCADNYEKDKQDLQGDILQLEGLLEQSSGPSSATQGPSGYDSRTDFPGLDDYDEDGALIDGFDHQEPQGRNGYDAGDGILRLENYDEDGAYDGGLNHQNFQNDSLPPATFPSHPATHTVDVMSRKRLHDELASSPLGADHPNKSHRVTPAHSTPGTTPSTPASDASLELASQIFAQQYRGNTVGGTGASSSSRQNIRVKEMLERQRQAEIEADKRATERRAQLECDHQMATKLQESNSLMENRQAQFGTSQAVFNRDGSIRVPSRATQIPINSESSSLNLGSMGHSQPTLNRPPNSFSFHGGSGNAGGSESSALALSSNKIIKNEPSTLPVKSPLRASLGTASNKIFEIDSDEGSDLEEIDAESFSVSARRRTESMAGFDRSLNSLAVQRPQTYSNNGYGMKPTLPRPDISRRYGAAQSYGGISQSLPSLQQLVGGVGSSIASALDLTKPFTNYHYQMPSAMDRFSIGSPSTGLFAGLTGTNQPSGSSFLDPVSDLNRAEQSRFDYLYSDASRTNEEIKKLIENIAPGEDLPPEMRMGTPNAMRMPLLEHQKIGLTWLKKQEEGSNKGGILADDMGLGKTIQALALMVSRPSDNPRQKTTLIVAPVALLRQWEFEIQDKLKDGQHSLSVFKHHGTPKKTSFKDLSQYDVVLTTFGTLASELKKKERWDYIVKNNRQAVPTARERLALIGDDCLWYRVIIDEAQCIKNKNTATARAAFLLHAKHRLCMTGTPMMNNVGELFSLIAFCRIKPFNDPTRFKFDIANPLTNMNSHEQTRNSAMKKLHALISAIMLRRTKTSQLDGKPIITLPPRTNELAEVEFTEDEQSFYTALESKTQLTFNRYMKAGTVMKNYANVLVLLLRLRQACCHPHLVRDHTTAGNSEVSAETMEDFAKNLAEEVVQRIKAAEGNFECPICYDGVENPTIFIPCGHETCSECFTRLTDPSRALGAGSESAEAKCHACRGKVDPKKVIDYNTFKKVYLEEPAKDGPVDGEAGNEEDDDDSDSDSDSNSDDDDSRSLEDFVVPDDVDDDNAEADGERKPVVKQINAKSKGKGKKKIKSKGKGKEKSPTTHKSLAQLRSEGLRNKKLRKKYMRRLAKDWVASAKIDKTLNLLREIQENKPGEKVLIFSQFTSLLDLLEIPMLQDGDCNHYRRYDGSMSSVERNDAVMFFKEQASCRVMLVSLKAGNAGLNLNCASQVIILDPFWNPFIEEQAIDRAHRIGQMNPVKVHRVLVPGTVEDRIVALQDKKRFLISAALDESAGKSVARLGVTELAYLFGVTPRA